MATAKELVSRNIADLRRELQLVASMFDAKIAWLNVISRNEINCNFTVTDNTINPPTIVRRIQFSGADLRNLSDSLVQEARRAFLNDLYLVASRYAVTIDNLLRRVAIPTPEFSPERRDAALNALNRFIDKDSKKVLDFLRRLRNSLVHYEGRHNKANALNDTILGRTIVTTDANIGEPIEMSMDQVYHLYELVNDALSERLLENQQLKRELDA